MSVLSGPNNQFHLVNHLNKSIRTPPRRCLIKRTIVLRLGHSRSLPSVKLFVSVRITSISRTKKGEEGGGARGDRGLDERGGGGRKGRGTGGGKEMLATDYHVGYISILLLHSNTVHLPPHPQYTSTPTLYVVTNE
jgi:hypothetical protein